MRTHEQYRKSFHRGLCLVRHVNDVAVSYYNWLQWWNPVDVDFTTFLQAFLSGGVASQGAWQDHVNAWLDGAMERDFLLVKYEDLRAAPYETLNRLLDHMGVEASEKSVRQSIENNQLEAMRRKERRAHDRFRGRDSARQFVRKGGVGDWRNWMSEQHLELVQKHAGGALARLGYGAVVMDPRGSPTYRPDSK